MSRILKEIEIEGHAAKALFDTGASYTYVKEDLLPVKSVRKKVKKSFSVNLGGHKIVVRELCLISGEIQGLSFETTAIPVKKIGRVDELQSEVDVLIGALTMEQWAIIPIPRTGELNLDGLKKREFTEF